MPTDNQTPRGNHFTANTRAGQAGRSAGGPAPDSTEAFMKAHLDQRAGRPPVNGGIHQPAAQPSPSRAAQTQRTAVGGSAQPARPSRQAQRASVGDPAQQARVNAAQNPYTSATRSGGNGTNPPSSNPYSSAAKPGKGKAGKIAAIVISIVVLGILVFGGVTGYFLYKDAKGLMGQARTLIADVSTLKDLLKDGSGEELTSTAGNIASQVSTMRETVSGPAWNIASMVPVYGGDVQYARGMLDAADTLANEALIPACEQLGGFSLGNLMQDGSINVDLLNSLISTIQSVEPVLSTGIEDIDALPEPKIGKLKEMSDKIKEPLQAAKTVLANINEIAPLFPQMLGGSGTRTYLLMAQQNAELRSTGGLPGSVGTLTIDNGAISMGEFEAGSKVDFAVPSSEVTGEEANLFTNRVGLRITDTNFNPDFPRVAHFAKAMWEGDKGGHVDGVIAIDPVFLQYLLAITGSFDTNGITVTGDNAAAMLLHNAYNDMSVEETDAFFSSVASSTFDQIMGNLGGVDFASLVGTIQRGIREHRLLVWMENADEQALMEKFDCTGALKLNEAEPELGVYFSDETWSKISWYFSSNTTMDAGTKNPDGSTTYHLTTTMTNNLTLAEASGQAAYVTGYNSKKRDITDMYVHVYLVAPAGGSISNIQTQGGDFSYQNFTEMPYKNWTFHTASPLLSGGETITITYDVSVSPNATETLSIRTTPTAQVVAGWGENAVDAMNAAADEQAAE